MVLSSFGICEISQGASSATWQKLSARSALAVNPAHAGSFLILNGGMELLDKWWDWQINEVGIHHLHWINFMCKIVIFVHTFSNKGATGQTRLPLTLLWQYFLSQERHRAAHRLWLPVKVSCKRRLTNPVLGEFHFLFSSVNSGSSICLAHSTPLGKNTCSD